MVEKRKLPGRNRGGRPPKKRLAEADVTPSPKRLQRHEQRRPSATPSKKAAETPAPSLPIEPPAEDTLPTKISDSQPLPTLPKPQTQSSLSEYQTYAESGAVAAALHRSRSKWLHDCLFEKYWTKPSKKKNQPQPTFQNPPKDSMTKLGPFRRPHSQPPSQQTQQKPMVQVQYTPPNSSSSFHEYHPRQHPNQSTPSKPPNIAPLHPQAPRQQQLPPQQQPQPPPPSSNVPPPAPVHQPPPVHPQARNTPQKPPNPPPPGKPSADPVIQLLANRAATNPDLRALMRIVADSQADQEQLRAFQAHIDEINAIIASRNPKDSQPHPPPVKTEPLAQMAATPVPAGGVQNRVHTPIASRSPAVTPGPTTYHPPNQHPHPSGSPYPHPPQGIAPIKAKNSQKLPPAQNGCFRPQYPPPVPQAPRMDIKGVVFEFILPAGANHGPTGDRYLFPENMILDYFPGNTTVIASFLAIKRIDPPGSSTETDKKAPAGKVKGKKAKLLQAPATPTPGETPSQTPVPQPDTNKDMNNSGVPAAEDPKAADPQDTTEPSSPSKGAKPKVKEYYQPVTLRLHANNPRTLEPLGRVVKSPGEVRDYMNNVMDRIERADIEYLALRLPREQRRGRGAIAGDEPGKAGGSIRATPRVKGTETESGAATPQNEDRGGGGDEVVEEELKDYYDSPCSLVPLRS
ncbi:uncharacterized protein GIQ15_03290 [Arthroderma uncinatum]|uniref:uncharacterized protein n=1 Tax=Arthroderma uncinatum TaxID=74035 RepID=UPI00144A7CEB|nr:uncharacterized protein GIQ15_03290 [Arthroderma uncinatum]KAF3483966.1 hypothetical protein GIQ15_03290 [Arthroderma uncinatum]